MFLANISQTSIEDFSQLCFALKAKSDKKSCRIPTHHEGSDIFHNSVKSGHKAFRITQKRTVVKTFFRVETRFRPETQAENSHKAKMSEKKHFMLWHSKAKSKNFENL